MDTPAPSKAKGIQGATKTGETEVLTKVTVNISDTLTVKDLTIITYLTSAEIQSLLGILAFGEY